MRRVNFTGSSRVGRLVAQTGAKYLKPVLLELGGKAPLIVLEDADIDAAVSATVFGAFANSGQICMSTERVVVHEKVADEFAAKLAKRVAALPSGDPAAKNRWQDALATLAGAQRERVDAYRALAERRVCRASDMADLKNGTWLRHAGLVTVRDHGALEFRLRLTR